jgi:uncharacterized protein Usg
MDLWLPDSFRLSRAEHSTADRDLSRQLSGQLLTTAEILYALPDHPLLLQTYLWQDYDLAPRFPVLQKFIKFWQRDIEGRLHRVTVSVRQALGDAKFTFYAAEINLN